MKIVIEIKGTPRDNDILVYNAKLGVYEPISREVYTKTLNEKITLQQAEIDKLRGQMQRGFKKVGQELTKMTKLLKIYTEEK